MEEIELTADAAKRHRLPRVGVDVEIEAGPGGLVAADDAAGDAELLERRAQVGAIGAGELQPDARIRAEAVEDRTDDGQVHRRARFDEDAPPAGQSSDRLIDAPDPESDPARQRPSEAAGRGHYIAP